MEAGPYLEARPSAVFQHRIVFAALHMPELWMADASTAARIQLTGAADAGSA